MKPFHLFYLFQRFTNTTTMTVLTGGSQYIYHGGEMPDNKPVETHKEIRYEERCSNISLLQRLFTRFRRNYEWEKRHTINRYCFWRLKA